MDHSIIEVTAPIVGTVGIMCTCGGATVTSDEHSLARFRRDHVSRETETHDG